MNEYEMISDETLTAYLDGALGGADAQAVADAVAADPDIAARLAVLDVPLDHLRAVMAPAALGAPQMPADLLPSEPTASPKSRLWVPAAVAAAFVAGIAVTPLMAPKPQPTKWVDAVASYQALYVTETLAAGRQPADQTAAVLTSAAAAFDVSIAPALNVAGLEFKRAQMLGWNGKPLLQMAYLAPDGTPMALCLTRVGAADRGPKSGISHKLAGVSWVQNGVGYYLVGGADLTLVETLSQDIIARL